MRTAVVTGAAGFTGRYMVGALKNNGFRVFGIGLGEPATSDWVDCDLRDLLPTKRAVDSIRPDVVIHLAAMAFVADAHPEEFYRVNVFGTLNLLEALHACDRKPSRVLIASSANVYGQASEEKLTETACPAPVNDYACSKLAMEHMAKTWFDRLPIVITRPFNYTGPGQDERFVVPKIVAHYRRRASVINLGDTRVERDFSDIEDVVEAYIRLIHTDVQSEIVNICRGDTISIAGILAEMNELSGYKIEVAVQPDLLRKSDIQRLVGDNTKLRNLTGFVPRTPIRETLRRMYLN
jgi:GDP-6-deoxy-D-talose 4-dehydrogenase